MFVVCPLCNIDELEAWINASYAISLNIPFERIESWKKQFRK